MSRKTSVRFAAATIATLLGVILLLAGIRAGMMAGERVQVFNGDISDSQCALNVHSLSRSHAEMLKKKNIGTTAAECARYCVKYMGGVFVLSVKEKVYKLDNQELAEKYAGQKVKLTGVLDPSTNTIVVLHMEPAN
jgi:hypothetical protein